MAKTNKGRKLFATTATAALVASAIVPVASAAQINDFNSIASYAQEAAQNLVDRGVIEGDANGNFSPRKSVSRAEAATVLTKALGLTTSEKVNFTDVKSGAWYYDAINAAVNNGVFSGKGAGIFEPNGNLTRGEAAIILVNAFNLDGRASLAQFSDEKSVKAWAVESLEIAVANGVIKGDNGKIKANDAITKQDFVVMFTRAEEASDAVGTTSTVKAINNTTVEVSFGTDIEDIKDLTFTIDGLKVTNAIVKQTAKNVAVLTTEAQEGGKEYTVSVDGTALGKFTGIAAVIPTSIKVETTSVQSKVGQQVTLKATTTPGAQVTFNVQATGNSLNENKKYEVTAGTDGVATYTYTQYGVAGVDNVTVYPTGAPNLLGYAKVYWGQDIILSVDAEAKTIDNGGNRVYTVTYKDATTGQPVSGKTLNVTFKENLNDIDASKTNDTTASIRKLDGLYVTPYQDTAAAAGSNREEAFQITTNSVGQATFTVTGKNTDATPIVFEDIDKNSRYAPTELQATAGAAKFQGVQSPYTITFDRTEDFVAAMSQEYGQQNPIAYKLKVVTDKKDKDGNAIPYAGATIKVAIQQNNDAPLNNNTPAQIASSENGSYTTNGVVSVVTDSKGEATVYLKSAVDNTKATPIAWIDLNTAGNTATVGNDRLEEGEPNAVAPTVTFLKSVVVAPAYSLNTPTVGSYIQGDRMTWKASLTNQSAKVSETAGIKNATYTVTNTSNKILTINPRLVDVDGNNYTNLTITYSGQTQTQSFVNGSSVRLEPGTTVTIHGNAPGLRSQYGQTTITQNGTTIITETNSSEYSTTNDALLHVVAPAEDGSLSVASNVTTVRKLVTQDTRNNNNTYTYDAKVAEFIKAQKVGTETVTGEVIGYEITDETTAPSSAFVSTNKFNLNNSQNYGRVVIKERHTGLTKVFYYDSADRFSAALDGSFNAQTDNVLGGATPFEALLTLNDEIQVNNTNAPSNQVGTVRLFNEDKSTGGKTSGNGVDVATFAITNAQTVSSLSNGTVDKLQVTFNKEVTQAELNALLRVVNNGTQYLDGVLVNGAYAVSNPVVTTAFVNGSTVVTFDIVNPEANNTAKFANATLTVTASEALKLDSSVALTSTINDRVAPVVLTAVAQDNDGKNGVDTVVFTFSEPIKSVIDLADFRFALNAADVNDATKFVTGKSSLFNTASTQLTVHFDNFNNSNSVVVDYAKLNSAVNNLGVVDVSGNDLGAYNTTLTINSTPESVALTALNTQIAAAKAAVTTGKTPASVSALNDAILAAEAVAKKSGATVKELNDAEAAVKAAVAGLKDVEGDVTGVVLSTIAANGANETAFQTIVSAVDSTKLTGDLAGATSLTLVVGAKEYKAAVNGTYFLFTVPTTDGFTKEQVLAGKVIAK